MAYKQLVKPNVHITAPPGWCLTYVQNTFNAPWAGASATDGWEMTKYKHPGQVPPEGVSAPVWFAMEGVPAGHVVTWMEDGSIWSASDNDQDADYHPNLQDLLNFYGGRLTLRGWSEDIGGLRVVEPVKEAPKPVPPKFVPMEEPRVMIAATGLHKFSPDTKKFSSKVYLKRGDYRLFVDKVNVDGKQYLRTEYDAGAKERLAFDYRNLIELPDSSEIVKKLNSIRLRSKK